MYRVALVVLLAGILCVGQEAPSSATAAKSIGQGAFPVKASKTLDSSKLKEGESVEVETAGSFKLPDGTLVPKGSKLVGHVAAAKARSKGDPDSRLTVIFDKLNIANGKQLSVKGMVQAVFPPPDEPDPGVPGAATSHGGGGAFATAGSAPPPDYKPMNDVKTGSNTNSNAHVDPAMDPKSTGVKGMHDLELGSDGALFSGGKRVKLDSGVRMIVHVDILQ